MKPPAFQSEYKSIDIKLLKRLLAFLKPYNKYIIIALSLTVFASWLGPLRPYLTKIAIDEKIASGDTEGLFYLITMIFGIIALHGLAQYGMSLMMQWVGQKVLLDIRNKLFSHIQSLSMRYFDKNPIGRLVTRVTNDIEALNELFSSGVVMVIADILLIFWISGFMFFINAELAFITLLVLPGLLLVTSVFRRKVRVLFRDLRLETAKMNSFLNEFLTGISTIKLFTQEKNKRIEFDSINSKMRSIHLDTIFWYALFFPAIEMLSAIALGLVLWYAGVNILSGAITVGVVIAFMQYAEMFFRPVRDLSEKYTTLQGAMAASERIFETLDASDFVKDNPETNSNLCFQNSIEFRNVSFSYDGEKQVLKNVSFTVKKGETVAIVGATGSGKSTIINLLCRFYDFHEGQILVDGKNIKECSQKKLRSRIALVMQDVFLFSRTVADNISLRNEKISHESVIEAAKAIGADGFISNLPAKYEEKLSERGSTLSSGQRQLIAFSRAFAANPEILILDEATSNIDTETEQLIENSLEKLFSGRTSIVIAHRLSTIKRAKKIIVLHRGEVREIGSHDELLEIGGLYSKLYRLQFGRINGNNTLKNEIVQIKNIG